MQLSQMVYFEFTVLLTVFVYLLQTKLVRALSGAAEPVDPLSRTYNDCDSEMAQMLVVVYS